MAKIELTVAYDGTHYLGWQKTKTGPSIEAALQEALQRFLQHEVALEGSSRTDAGVHARAQIVRFETDREDLSGLKKSLNSMLPRDIAVWGLDLVENFEPVRGKVYHYYICNSEVQLPCHRLYSWHIRQTLDLEAMRLAAGKIVGKRDFSAFCNVKKNESYEDHVREVKAIEIESFAEDRIVLKITGDSFLYKMARNIVGTLCYIGLEKIPEDALPDILSGKDRTEAGITAPAHGLFLYDSLFAYF